MANDVPYVITDSNSICLSTNVPLTIVSQQDGLFRAPKETVFILSARIYNEESRKFEVRTRTFEDQKLASKLMKASSHLLYLTTLLQVPELVASFVNEHTYGRTH